MGNYCSQVVIAQPPRASWVENQLSQEISDSQTASDLSENSYRLSVNVSSDYTGTLPEHQRVAVSFKLGTPCPLRVFQRMLGLITAASSVIPLGLLHMRPLQYWLKARIPSHTWRLGCFYDRVTHRCVKAVALGQFLARFNQACSWERPPEGR